MTSTICDQVATDGQVTSLASEICRLMEVHQLNLFDLATQTGIMPEALTRFFQATNSKVMASPSTARLVHRLQTWLNQFKLRQLRRSSVGASKAAATVKLNPYFAKQREIIKKHQQDGAPANLIPITLALTMLQPGPLTRFGLVNKNASGVASFADSFLWNPDQTDLKPTDFLRQTLIDSKLDPNLWQPQLEKQMMKQIQDYRTNQQIKMESETKMDIDTAGSSTSPHTTETNVAATSDAIVKPVPSDSSSNAVESKENSIASSNLLKLELDLVHNGVRLQDNIIWNPASSSFDEIESFANTYCRELGLPGEFAVKVFWTIHEQLAVARQHPPLALPSSEVSSLLRDSRTAKHWTPLVRPDPKRHAVIVAQRPPPPYIAHHISAGHRHAIYLGELIDMEQNILPIPASGLPDSEMDPSASTKPDGPESYSFISCTTKTLRLKRWSQPIDDSETIEPAPPTPAPTTSNRFSLSIPRSSRTLTRPSSSTTATTTSPSPSSSTIISLKRLRSAMTASPAESDASMTPIDDSSASMARHASDDWDRMESNIVEEVDENEEAATEVEEEAMMEEEKETSPPPVATETSTVVETTNGRIKLRLRR